MEQFTVNFIDKTQEFSIKDVTNSFKSLTDTPSTYSGQAGKTATVNSGETAMEFTTPAGGGDMVVATYDPTSVSSDAFDMDNMAEGVTTKILTSTERTAIDTNTSKVSYTDSAAVALNTAKISYTDASAVALNTAKVTYPSTDSTKVGHISVTQAVDLDTMESNIATNNAKTGVTTEEANTIDSELEAGMTGEDLVLNVLSLTTAEYGAGTPIATTFYIITDA